MKNKNSYNYRLISRYCLIVIPLVIIGFMIIWAFFHFRGIATPIEFNRNQFYEVFVKAISAFFTLCAVIVALFKEQIIGLVKYAHLEISARDQNSLYENLEKSDIHKSSEISTVKAKSYESFLVVKNTGNRMAEGCTFQIEEISFTRNNAVAEQLIDTANSNPFEWKTNSAKEITIHPNNKAIVSILRLVNDQSVSTPGNEQSRNAQLIIGDVVVNEGYSIGTWKVVFILSSKNTKVQRYTCTISWNGDWHQRLEEMKPFFKIVFQ